MKTAKQEALEVLEHLPDEVSMDAVLYELYLRAAVRAGDEDFARGRVLDHEEVKERVQKWLASGGRSKLFEI